MDAFAMVFLLIALLPHIIYFFAFNKPSIVLEISGYNNFVLFSIFWKIITALSLFIWLYSAYKWRMFTRSQLYLGIGLLLIVIGQTLNLSAYKQLRKDGVYYGRELGIVNHELPEITGFPYNIMSHPLFIGCILTILGLAFLFGFNKKKPRKDVWFVMLTWISFYMFSILVENM